MATSSGGGIGDVVSFKSAGDLSDKQYCAVRLTAANTVGTVNISGTDYLMGILQNKPEAANSPADVMVSRGAVTKVVTNGTLAAGAWGIVGTDARIRAGLAADVAATVHAGIALEAATTTAAAGGGDIISFLFIPTIGTTS